MNGRRNPIGRLLQGAKMTEWFNNLKRKNEEQSRRIYYFDKRGDGLGVWPRTIYIEIDEFRSGDDWKNQRDRLKLVVERQFLSHASIVSIGQISYWRVWSSIIPSVVPSHWITAGYRSTRNRWDKVPVIQFPASLGTSESVLKDLAKPMTWAIDALPLPLSLTLERSERAVFSLTLLSELAVSVRGQMSRR